MIVPTSQPSSHATTNIRRSRFNLRRTAAGSSLRAAGGAELVPEPDHLPNVLDLAGTKADARQSRSVILGFRFSHSASHLSVVTVATDYIRQQTRMNQL